MGRNSKLRYSYLEKDIYNKPTKTLKYVMLLLVALTAIVMVVSGCGSQNKTSNSNAPSVPSSPPPEVNVPEQNKSVDLEVKDDSKDTRMVSYDVMSVGRSNPFMPYGEYQAYEQARRDAINEANEHNARISRLKVLQNQKIREQDDISPYSFNLPVPPTSLAGEDSTAVKITKTKVVGIMYNPQSPSAIINVDQKDYLVRPGDKIIDEQYIVQKINKTYITVNMGANVYSAAIGELFSKDGIETNQTDLYNLEHRFGGRKG